MNSEDMKKFRRGVPPGIDTGSSMKCLMEWLLCKDIWKNEYESDEFLNWIRNNQFKEEQLKDVIYQLDQEGLIAIDPYDQFIEVQEYKPNACQVIRGRQKKFRLELEYGHIEEENIEEVVPEEYLVVLKKSTDQRNEFPTREAMESHYGIEWGDRREHRKGLPSKFDDLEITEKYRGVKKFMGKTKKVVVKPDGKKLYGGNEFKRTIKLLSKYDESTDYVNI